MTSLNRRAVLAGAVAFSFARLGPAAAQQDAAAPVFAAADVIRRARDLASAPFDPSVPPLPESVAALDFDAWREIRFKTDKPLIGAPGATFRLELVHLGYVYKRPVVVNVLRDGIPAPIPYASNLFDYGRVKIAAGLPVNLGFAGFRLQYPLNAPRVMDEVASFLGGGQFRFVGRGQRQGLSARGLGLGAGAPPDEEAPFFREFWVETPDAAAERIVVHALLDGASATGAFRFEIAPALETTIDVSATLFARRPAPNVNLAPLSSMFLRGGADHRVAEDFREDVHDSDGLFMHTGAGEWIWRPVSNPASPVVSTFVDSNPRGFGLLQRDRVFEQYQDLDRAYESRPTYWIEPRDNWGDGGVQLVELPTDSEAVDNIAVSWAPKGGLEAGRPLAYGYRITALTNDSRLMPGARAVNTFRAPPRPLGSTAPVPPGATRFLIDFSGGDLGYYLGDSSGVEVVASTSQGRVSRTFLASNSHVRGFRASVDVELDPGQVGDVRVYLRAGVKTLTETWTFPWRA
jgi:glucans biosynthesis protein